MFHNSIQKKESINLRVGHTMGMEGVSRRIPGRSWREEGERRKSCNSSFKKIWYVAQSKYRVLNREGKGTTEAIINKNKWSLLNNKCFLKYDP